MQTLFKGGRLFDGRNDPVEGQGVLVDAGMTAIDALIAGTSSAADLLGVGDEGTISEGNSADLVLVDGDPSVDIFMASRAENHRIVMKRGVTVVDRRTR